MHKADVDIIIPVLNKKDISKACLESIQRYSDIDYNLILIDNGSEQETADFLDGFKASNDNVALIRNAENLGWVKAINQGVSASKGRYACIMNNDTVVRTPNWLSGLISVAEMSPDIGLINPCFETKKECASKGPYIEVDFCRGYCILIKRDVIDKIGLMDESYGLGYYDDDDYSMRAIQAGFRCVMASNVVVEHLRDSTFSDLFKDEERAKLHEHNKRLFYAKWGRRLRLTFIISGRYDKDMLTELFLALARKQHIISIWNASPQLSIGHTNISERRLDSFSDWCKFIFFIVGDKFKKIGKKCDCAFFDKQGIIPLMSKACLNRYYVDFEKERADILDTAASLART